MALRPSPPGVALAALVLATTLLVTASPAAAAAGQPWMLPLTARSGAPRALAAGTGAALPLDGTIRETGYYTATLAIGTPPVAFDVIVDTASTMTYVPCASCGKACGPHHQGGYAPARSSTGDVVRCGGAACECGTSACGCSPDGACTFAREYAEASSAAGVVVTDVVELPPPLVRSVDGADAPHAAAAGASTATGRRAPVANGTDVTPARIVLGCTTKETGAIFAQAAAGVAGLGNASTGLAHQLAAAGAIDRVALALCLAPDADGRSRPAGGADHSRHRHPHGALVLGGGAHAAAVDALAGPLVTTPLAVGTPNPHYYSVNVASMSLVTGGDGDGPGGGAGPAGSRAGAQLGGPAAWRGGVALDSGSTFTFLPAAAAAEFRDAVATAADDAGFDPTPSPAGGYGDPCWRVTGDGLANGPSAVDAAVAHALPVWRIELPVAAGGGGGDDNGALELPATHYMFAHPSTPGAACLGVAPLPAGRGGGGLLGAVSLRGLLVEVDVDGGAVRAARADCAALGAAAAVGSGKISAVPPARRERGGPFGGATVVTAVVGVPLIVGAVGLAASLAVLTHRRRARRAAVAKLATGVDSAGGGDGVELGQAWAPWPAARTLAQCVAITLPAGAVGVPALAAAAGGSPDACAAAALAVETAALAAVAAVIDAAARRDPGGVAPPVFDVSSSSAVGYGVGGALAAAAAVAAVGAAPGAADSGATAAAAAMLQRASTPGAAALLAASCAVAPALEEAVYRGVACAALVDAGAPRALAVAASAAAFAASHAGVAPADVPALTALGAVLGGVWVASGRNCAAAALAHGLYNAGCLVAGLASAA